MNARKICCILSTLLLFCFNAYLDKATKHNILSFPKFKNTASFQSGCLSHHFIHPTHRTSSEFACHDTSMLAKTAKSTASA